MNIVFTRVSAWGAHLILGSQRGRLFEGGALSREALIKYIKKDIKILSTFSNNNNRRIKCLMFTIVCKTPLP